MYSPDRLRRSIDQSSEKYEKWLKSRERAVANYLGANYQFGYDVDSTARPMPIDELAVDTWVFQLTASPPKALVDTDNPSLKPDARNLEVVVNMRLAALEIEQPIRQAVKDAIFGLGLVKRGLKPRTEDGEEVIAIMDGQEYPVTEQYIESVGYNDAIFDMQARKWSDIRYIGNWYLKPKKWVEENESFNADAKEQIATASMERNQQKDDYLEDMCWLGDVYIPRYGTMVTMLKDAPSDTPYLQTKTIDRRYPDPYEVLTFLDVPGELLPLPPEAVLRDLSDLTNDLWNKIVSRALQEKINLTWDGATISAADVEKYRTAQDMEVIQLPGDGELDLKTFPGASRETIALALQAKNEASWFGGNLEAMAGLGPQADTLGQEKIIQGSVSGRLNYFQMKVLEFADRLIQGVAYYEWYDPVSSLTLTKTVPGTDVKVPFRWAPDTRRGDFPMYDIRIEPYSMGPKTPQMRLAAIERYMSAVAPILPMLMQQGGSINLQRLTELYSDYQGEPRLKEIVVFGGVNPDAAVRSHEASKATITTRNVNRVNSAAPTKGRADMSAINSLLASKGQERQAM